MQLKLLQFGELHMRAVFNWRFNFWTFEKVERSVSPNTQWFDGCELFHLRFDKALQVESTEFCYQFNL